MGTFAGLAHEFYYTRRPYTSPIGFRGIAQELPDNIRFVRVTDFKGVPMQGVNVTVHNVGGSITTVTDQDGQTDILPDAGATVLIDLKQYSTELKNISYTTDTEPRTRTIILDTIVPHL